MNSELSPINEGKSSANYISGTESVGNKRKIQEPPPFLMEGAKGKAAQNKKLKVNAVGTETLTIPPKQYNHAIDAAYLRWETRTFTNWTDVLVSEKGLLSKAVQAMDKTEQWVIQSHRQQKRLSEYWADLTNKFNEYLIGLTKKPGP